MIINTNGIANTAKNKIHPTTHQIQDFSLAAVSTNLVVASTKLPHNPIADIDSVQIGFIHSSVG